MKALLFFLSLLPKLRLLGLFYNPTNPIFQHFSLTSTVVILPFPSLVVLFLPISIFLSCLHFSLSLSLSHCFSTLLRHSLFYFIFLCVLLCLVLGVWVVRKRGKAKRNIYIFLFWYVLWIYTWFWVFYFYFYWLLGVWVLRKCGKAKGSSFFFSLICLVSKKLEATESQPNQTDWNPISLVLVFLPYSLVSIPNLVKPKISVRWKNHTSNQSNHTDYTPS